LKQLIGVWEEHFLPCVDKQNRVLGADEANAHGEEKLGPSSFGPSHAVARHEKQKGYIRAFDSIASRV
jgi:hypothetical protein